MYGAVVVFQPSVYGAHSQYGHVAFVDWVDPNNPTYFSFSEMGCSGKCVVGHRGPKLVIQGVNFIYPPCAIDTTPPSNPTSVTSTTHTLYQWSANRLVTVQWAGASDPGTCAVNGIGGYAWVWTQDPNTIPTPPDLGDANTLQATSPLLATGHWYFHVRARDKSNNWADGAAHYGPFWIDADAPHNPTVQEMHGAPQGWQHAVNDPEFSWSGASDGIGSGVNSYTLYWGESKTGTPDVQTTAALFDPAAPCGTDTACYRYLRIQTTDYVLRVSDPETLFEFGYDGASPTGTFQINNGSTVVFQVMVQIQVEADDVGSGLAEMRLSNDGLIWPYDWQPFAPFFEWQLDYLPNMVQTVHMEVRDTAGNMTALPLQSVYLDLSSGWPRSENYELVADVQGSGGGFGLSASHALTGTIGQVIAGGGISGTIYSLDSGFQGAWPANPVGPPPVTHYELINSVIGQGGGTQSSDNYQLDGTLGQPQEPIQMVSTNYDVASGFWAWGAPVGLLPPSPMLFTEITLTPNPTPTSTSTLPLEFYGVSINGASLYTNDNRVTLSMTAPNAVEMMVSNDGGFGGAYWEAYDITKIWEIDFYQSYVLPRTVYVRYRDADGVIYGNFTDDIIYDPNLPEGSATVTGVSTDTVTIYIDLQDDLSGVSDVMVTTSANLPLARWEPYTPWKTVAAQPGNVVYVYYRDAAGNESLYPFELIVPGSQVFLPMVIKP